MVRFENQIYLANTKINELSEDISWDQKKLEEWLQESSTQDDNVLTLHKYMKEDDSKLKQLMLIMERLTDEVKKARKVLDAEHTETLTAQIEVDKTAEDFRKQQAEREELIQQWKHSLDQMKTRDKEVTKISKEIADALEVLEKEKSNLNQQQAFYDAELQNNQELDKKIDERQRIQSKMNDTFQAKQAELSQVSDELQTLKFGVERIASESEQLKSKISTMKNDHAVKSAKLETLKENTEATKQQLKLVEGQQLTAEQRAAASEQILNHEESIVKNLMDQVKKAREMQFKREQQLVK